MNDLTALRDLGAALDSAATEPPAELRHRVMVATSTRPRPARRPVPRLVPSLGWRLVVAGGLAVAVTAGVFTLLPERGDDSSARHPGLATPGGRTEAAEILHNAALAAANSPLVEPRDDQLIFVESVSSYPETTAGPDGVSTTIPPPKSRQVWLSVDGTHDGLLRERPSASTGPWDETPLAGCRDGQQVVSGGGQTGPAVTRPCKPYPNYQPGLPTNADEMLHYLYANSHGDNPPDQQAFITVGDMIREAYLSPQVLAALFDAAAKIPDVTVVRDVADAAGRHGVAVARSFNGVREELIFDATSYTLLGEREIGVADGPRSSDAPGCGPVASGGTDPGLGCPKPGTLYGLSAQLRVAIVDQAGQLP